MGKKQNGPSLAPSVKTDNQILILFAWPNDRYITVCESRLSEMARQQIRSRCCIATFDGRINRYELSKYLPRQFTCLAALWCGRNLKRTNSKRDKNQRYKAGEGH